MADNVSIGTGLGAGTATLATDEVGGAHVQRVKVQHGTDGSAVDASASNPLPTTDTATKTAVDAVKAAVDTLRAATTAVTVSGTVPVDTELPTAAVPSEADTNTAVPAVAARLGAMNPSGTVGRLYRTLSDGGPQPMERGLHTTPTAYDVSATSGYPSRTARSMTDVEGGQFFTPIGNMLFNGATWQRERTSTTSPTLLHASAARATTSNGAFPWANFSTFNCATVLLMLHVTGVGTGSLYVVVKAPATNAALVNMNVTSALVAGAAPGGPVDVCLMLGTAAAYGSTMTGNSIPALKFGVVGAPIPAPGIVSGYVQHTDTSTWTYSLDYYLIS